VKLLDFGVAMSAVTEQAETMIVGKWLYMSPEHTQNQQIDHRSDLFSLGVITYLLCTGAMPFSGSEPKEIVRKIRAGQYKPLQQAAPNIPEALAELVGRLLSSNPDDRPQTGHEVVAVLNEITRTYGIESSTSDMAEMLANLFPDEQGDAPPGTVEIVRATRHDLDVSATKRDLPPGSGSLSSSLSAASGSPSPVTPSRVTPSSLRSADVSMSLTRRSGRLPEAVPEPPPVDLRPSGWLRTLALALVLAALAVAAYMIVRPT